MNPNQLLKFKVAILLLLCCPFFTCQENSVGAAHPNIIVFLVDDMGWQDTSVPFWKQVTPFNKRYRTPNMERLAAGGMKFTQAYANCVCTPTRVSMITGMNAARHRVTNWTLKLNEKPDGKDSILQVPEWNMNGLNTQEGINNTVVANTLPQLLKRENYFTIHVGKAHFAATETPCANPLNCGFDVNIAGHAAGAPGSYQGTDNFGNKPDGSAKNSWSVPGLAKYHGQDINLTEALTQEALHVLDTVITKKQPFYLYMAHYAVHIPIQPDHRFVQKYLESGLDTIEARYASMVESMDKSLGDLMDYLEQKGLEENTAILFMSDNGGLSAVARGGKPHTHNWPLSSGKGSAREGGVREPMLVKWPGVVEPGSICNDYLIVEDFFPTILDIANVSDKNTVQSIDGQSFIPKLKQERTSGDPRPLYWHYPNIWGPHGPGIGAYSAIRYDRWKLIYYHKERNFELFDLADDIMEEHNLAEEQIEKTKELAAMLSNYLRSVDAQMPTVKQTGETVPWPDEVLLD